MAVCATAEGCCRAAWVEASTSRQVATPYDVGYGYWWWVGGGGDRPAHFSARGNHGQFVFVFPELDVVMVRFGSRYGHDDWSSVFEQLAPQFAD